MDLFETIKNRRSIRAFQEKEVESDKLARILEAANAAPSAGNRQAYEIVLVKDIKRRIKFVDAAFGREFVGRAPLVLVFCVNMERSSSRFGKRGAELYAIQDATIAAAHADLAAASLGLGACWVGAFDEEQVRKIINCQDNLRPITLLPIGYPAEKPDPKSRRPIEDLVHEEVLK